MLALVACFTVTPHVHADAPSRTVAAAGSSLRAASGWSPPAASGSSLRATSGAAPPACPRSSPGLASAASVFPGFVIHGSGHLVNGCAATGARLLWLELAGLGLIVTALAPAVVLGANDYLVPIQAFLGMSGVALFSGSWLLDMYGSFAPADARGSGRTRAPVLETQLGYRYVYDPIFDYRHFVVQGFEWWHGSLRLMPRADFAREDMNVRYSLPVAWRWFGTTPERAAPDGSFAEVQVAATHHGFPRDGFDVQTLEVGVESRLDLLKVDPEFGGTFAELGAGLGVNRYDYEAPGAGHDNNGLLLMGFALGAYFGDPDRRGGEVKLGYDHRHDDYAAGIKLSGVGSGAAGHFGLEARGYWDEWGLLLDAQVGSAYVMGLSVLFRQGGSFGR